MAKTVAFDPAGSALGVPMTVVEFVEGTVIRDQTDLAALTDAQVGSSTAALVAALADACCRLPRRRAHRVRGDRTGS